MMDFVHDFTCFEQPQGVGYVFAVSCPALSGLFCGGWSSKQWCLSASAKFEIIKLYSLFCMNCHPRVGICILQKFREFFFFFWVLLLLDLGTEDGPSVCTKLHSTLTTVAFLQTNL